MNIQQNLTAIAERVETNFGTTDGVGLVVFTVLAGGAGGTITEEGVYTAPVLNPLFASKPEKTIDTIQAEDSEGTIATATIRVLQPLGLLANIIAVEMGLEENQVHLYNQKFQLPKDQKVYLSVGVLTDKPFSNKVEYKEVSVDEVTSKLVEVTSTSWRGMCSVEIQSSSTQALLRRHEVVMSLVSTYSEQQQEANSFKIAKLSSNFVNLSKEEGPGIPYRFNISVNMIYSTVKEKDVSYFENINPIPVIDIK